MFKKMIVTACLLLSYWAEAKAQSTSVFDGLGHGLLATVIFALVGFIMVFLAYKVIDKITPGDFAKQISEDKNVALAIVYGSTILGISIIIAAAIAG